ncbi:zinc knuckle CX2CX4HX4C containing protein [Tanacetum coccineum]
MSSSFSMDLVALSKRMSKLKDLDEGKKGNDVFHRQPIRDILRKTGENEVQGSSRFEALELLCLAGNSNSETPIVQSVDTNKLNERINVFSMVAENRFEGVNISIPRKVVEKVSTRYENTLYGYFIGKRMAFPVVEYYVKNNWNKYGLKRIMMNAKGFFFFQFNTRDGLDDVLEGGPWIIRNSPIILKEWTMKTSLHKEELTSIPVWVKFHDVPIQIFEEEGISLIATYIGKPIMLDSFTSSMCKESWGRSSFARVLIEIASDSDFKENIIVGVPDLDGLGESCPKRVVAAPEVTNIVRDDHDDGFQQVRNRKRNSKGNTKGKQAIPRGVPMSKGFQVGKEFAFNPKATVLDSNGGSKSAANSKASSSSSLNKGNLDTHSNVSKPGPSITTNDRHSAAHLNDGGKKSIVIDSNSNLNTSIPTSNPYDALKSLNEDDDSEEEDVENIFDESVNLFTSQTGASTPADISFNV